MSAFLFINSRELKNLYRFKIDKSIEPLVNTVCKTLIVNYANDDDEAHDAIDVNALSFGNIILNKETGINARSFHGNVNVSRHNDYQSILVLVYNNLTKPPLIFPNRVTPYRNHFCIYTGLDDSVIIVRSETTLRYQDHDAVLQYDVLRLSDNALTTTCRKRWIISYDACVSSTTKCPENFVNYVLCCSGEWWFFDRGIILNGTRDRHSLLVYYELHAKCQFKRRETIKLPSFSTSLSNNDVVTNKPTLLPDSHVAKLPKFAQLIAENESISNNDYDQNRQRSTTTTDGLFVGNSSRDIAVDTIINDVKNHDESTLQYVDFEAIPLPRPRLSTLLPSSWWFTERDRELQKGDISYFIPT